MINHNTSTTTTSSSLSLFITISSLLLLLLQNIPTCSSQQEEDLLQQWYDSCGSLYACGDQIKNISYPFWGGTRPRSCGHPSLELQCNETTGATTLQFRTLQYQVLSIDSNDTSLKIVRLDLRASDGTCPTTFVDTALDFTILDYAPGYDNITILYGCSPLDEGGSSYVGADYFHFSCPFRGTNLTDAYAAPTGITAAQAGCKASVVVPIHGSLENLLGTVSVAKFSLEESIEEGFEVVYRVDNTACIACVATDGRCGYDSTKNVTVCVCPDGSLAGSENHTCNGVGGGATTAGTLTVFFFFSSPPFSF